MARPNNFRSYAPTPAPPPLVSVLDRLTLADALDEGAPVGAISYLETLAEALEDGEVSDQEASDLTSVAHAMSLTDDDVRATHRAFVRALTHEAMSDGRVSRIERTELLKVATALDVDPNVMPALLNHAEIAREKRLSQGLKTIPQNWRLGEPLRVGDRIVMTGCHAFSREELTARATALGVRVVGSVSGRTAMLVSDGTMFGTKTADAQFLGIRVVHPTGLVTLLDYLQPALPREARPLPKPRTPTGRSHVNP